MSSRQHALNFLCQHPGESFTGGDLAEHIIRLNPEWVQEKLERSGPNTHNRLREQVQAEFGGSKNRVWFAERGVHTTTGERPQRFYFRSPRSGAVSTSTESSTTAGAAGNLNITRMTLDLMRQHPGRSMSAKEVMGLMEKTYPDMVRRKRGTSPRPISSEKARELVYKSVIDTLSKKSKANGIPQLHHTSDRPMLFYWQEGSGNVSVPRSPEVSTSREIPLEEALYEPLRQYLRTKHNVYANRIDERKGSNSKGKGGNHWLFPDIAGFRPISEEWSNRQKEIMKLVGGSQIEFWSIEVKRELGMRNLRESYFQAVSNSSWANLGYLAAPFRSGRGRNEMLEELQMLSDLHGVGFLRLDFAPEGTLSGEIMLPARRKENADWTSLNRLTKENDGLMDLIVKVETYLKVGQLPRN